MRTFTLNALEEMPEKHNVLLSPLSLRGNQDKWYYSKECLIVKAALFDGFVHWEDWKVEVLASQLLLRLGIQAVNQKACQIDDGYGNMTFGSYSKDYRGVRERYYSFGRLLDERHMTERFPSLSTPDKIACIVDILGRYIDNEAAARFVEDMCLADYVLGNVDRHYDNYGILIRRDEQDAVVSRRSAPLYDFGMGLFQGQKEGAGEDLETAISSMLASTFAISLTDSFTFYKDVWIQRCRNIRIDLSEYDFPEGLAKQYLAYALCSLGIETEG
jgi:hypothetical protein